MKILLVKRPGTDLSEYIKILEKRNIDFEEIELPISGNILDNDSIKKGWCESFYKKYKETIDGVQFFLPASDWPKSRNLLGLMFNKTFSGYLTSCVRMRNGYHKTAEHELLHKIDNWVKIYLGISIERIMGISNWDEVVVHGDVPGDEFVEYDYDKAWELINPYLTQAIIKRKNQALLGYFEQLLIMLRKLVVELEAKMCKIRGMSHPIPGKEVSYKYGVPDTVYALTKHHIGTDYATEIGTPVLAPKDGEVVVVGNSASLGNFCHYRYSKDGKQYVARFLHLNEIPTPGKYKNGQEIAKTGNTGMSTGPHLHIDVWKDEVRLDLINDNNWQQMTVDPETHFA